MEVGVALWAIAVIGGPIVLGAVLAFGRIRNQRKRKREAAAQGREGS